MREGARERGGQREREGEGTEGEGEMERWGQREGDGQRERDEGQRERQPPVVFGERERVRERERGSPL